MPLVPWIAVRQSTAPVVATFHTHRELGHRWYGPSRWLLDPLMRRVRVRLAVSDAARRTIAGHFGGDYEIVPNGIDTSRFVAVSARPAAMRPDRPHVLCVGRLEPRKGIDRLIRAMTAVREHEPAVRLVVVGEGPDRASLESLAADIGADVAFAGRVSDGELPAYYRAADIVCSPALGGESFGVVLLEGMAAGRPVVATRIEGYEELVRDTAGVTLVERDDVGALAGAMSELLQEPERRRAMGAQGAAFAQRYDWSVIAERLESIYRSALAP
jgi:phosphatidylinositol alpha-mannosyltransferase